MREDTQKAIKKFNILFIFRHLKEAIEDAEKMLEENETVLFAEITNLSVTYIGTNKTEKFIGVIFLTDKRIFFKSRSLKVVTSESIPLNDVISVHCTLNKLANGHIEIQCPTKIYSIEVASRLEELHQINQEFETAVNNYKSQHAAQSSSPQPNALQPDITDQIEKLAGLRDKGIITEEEFQSKKTDLLSRM
ncbi:MAG: SHOCT domain-containing protein [Oscillospiraceae bacterium]|nr:SHOCT domain-containing protein [Oscillospiraceae bacterium]